MREGDSGLKRISEHAKNAIATMTQMRVPLTPENYHVWFGYLEGTNEELTRDVRDMLAGGAFSQEAGQELYDRHFGAGKEQSLLKQVHAETQKILRNILEEIISTQSFASEYRDKLAQYARKLEYAGNLTEIEQIIQELMRETSRMAEASIQLEERLEQTTSETESLRQRLKHTQREALVDPLTGLHNRRAFDRKLAELHEEFRGKGTVFALVMLDVDYFKTFNDRYGHRIGDAVLQVVASLIHESIKGRDFPARYGGEEFVVLLPGTGITDARTVAEGIRRRISDKRFKLARSGQSIGRITVSAGVAAIAPGDTAGSLVERADRALYRAKDSGRDAVRTQDDLEITA